MHFLTFFDSFHSIISFSQNRLIFWHCKFLPRGTSSKVLKNEKVSKTLVHFHLSAFGHQCWQKSESWRVRGKARGTRFYRMGCQNHRFWNNVTLYITRKNTWVHCWAWCPVTCCKPKPGALLGIMPSNRLHSACNPHALLGMMPSNVQVLPGTDTLLGMMPSNVPFLGCKSALCWAWCPATSPAMRKLCKVRVERGPSAEPGLAVYFIEQLALGGSLANDLH